MLIPDPLKKSTLFIFSTALVGGFLAGWGGYRGMLAATNQEPVVKGSYILKADITGTMVLKRDAIQEIDKLIDEGTNLPDNPGTMVSWLQQVIVFIHYLALPKDVIVAGEKISYIEKSILWAQSDPVVKVQVSKTLGALKGFRDAEVARISQP